MTILVVGDKAKINDGLTKLGYELIELDTDGNVLKQELKEAKKEDLKKEEIKPDTQPQNEGKKKAKVVIDKQTK